VVANRHPPEHPEQVLLELDALLVVVARRCLELPDKVIDVVLGRRRARVARPEDAG